MPEPRPLSGRTVAITEHRFERELTRLIERKGGTVVSCPLLEEAPLEDVRSLDAFVMEIIDPGFDLTIFFTGVGFRFLHERAVALDQEPAFLSALERGRVVARGPKPQAALRKLGLKADLTPEVPTSEGLLELLKGEMLDGRRVGVQLYGTPNDAFCAELEARGADLRTVQVYEYRAVSDASRVAQFIERLLEGIDAVTFTSAPQVASLFSHAGEMGRSGDLVRAMRGPLVVAAIGGVTNRALEARGVGARILPESTKMAPMVDAIARYFEDANR